MEFERQTAGKKRTQGFPRFEAEPDAQPPWMKGELEAEAAEADEVSELSEAAVNELFKVAAEAETQSLVRENVSAERHRRFRQDVAVFNSEDSQNDKV